MKNFINASGRMLISTLQLTNDNPIEGNSDAYLWNGWYDLNVGVLARIKMIIKNGTRN
tara:strand:+ start:6727 stop:6900 length:174 start_codon:yes stop_codon:yes gene_type:complete